MAAILEEGFLESLVLPADLKSLEGLPLDQLCHIGLAHTNIGHLPLGPQSKLRSLDLYAAGLTNLPQLPDSIQWLDLRASSLARDPEPYPEVLEYLATDAHRVTEQTGFPAGIRGLAFNFREAKDAPSESLLMARIRRNLPEGLAALELWSLDEVKRLTGLPRELRELRLIDNTNIQTLEGLPESLDRLFLKGNNLKLGLDDLPSYLTELHFMETSYVQSREALRFVEVLSIGAELTVLKGRTELPRLEDSRLSIVFRQEPSEQAQSKLAVYTDQLSELPLLKVLQLRIKLDEIDPPQEQSESASPKQVEDDQRIPLSNMPLTWLTSLSLQGAAVELALTNFPRLQSLTLDKVDPSRVRETNKDVWNQLKELDVTLTGGSSLARLPPKLRKLVVRGRGASAHMPVPSHVSFPPTLEHLVLHKVDADAWTELLSKLERLETVILDDVDVSGLEWIPKSVRHLGFTQTENKDRGFGRWIDRMGCPVNQ